MTFVSPSKLLRQVSSNAESLTLRAHSAPSLLASYSHYLESLILAQGALVIEEPLLELVFV